MFFPLYNDTFPIQGAHRKLLTKYFVAIKKLLLNVGENY